jgi:hypothetical protein
MTATGRALILSVAFLTTACAHSARPVRFTESVSATAAKDVIARAVLGAVRLPEADRQQGTITTPWADTGDRFPAPDSDNAIAVDRQTIVVRRYHIRVAPQDGATSVQINVEAKRCEPGFEVAGENILGRCEDLTRIFPKLQRDLDDLGARLRSLVANPAAPRASRG